MEEQRVGDPLDDVSCAKGELSSVLFLIGTRYLDVAGVKGVAGAVDHEA